MCSAHEIGNSSDKLSRSNSTQVKQLKSRLSHVFEFVTIIIELNKAYIRATFSQGTPITRPCFRTLILYRDFLSAHNISTEEPPCESVPSGQSSVRN